jgi:aspartokinase
VLSRKDYVIIRHSLKNKMEEHQNWKVFELESLGENNSAKIFSQFLKQRGYAIVRLNEEDWKLVESTQEMMKDFFNRSEKKA